MKKILIALIHSMIAFTIIHAPIVLQYPVSYGVAFAQEVDLTTQEVVDSTSGSGSSEPTNADIPNSGAYTGVDTHSKCGDSNTTDEEGNYLYRPGCAFKNEASLVDQLKPQWYDLLFNTILALVFVSMLIYLRTPRDILDCPGNVASKISWWTAKIGSLVYIISEFVTNAVFREIAKEAVDKNFALDKDADAVQTDKQLQAFNTLINIYEQQLGAAQAKLGFSIGLEVAYLTAEGAEIANVATCTGECALTYESVEKELLAAEAALEAIGKTYNTAIAPITAFPASKACLAFLTEINLLELFYMNRLALVYTLSAKEIAVDTTTRSAEKTSEAAAFALFTPLVVPVSIFSEVSSKAELAKDAGEATANAAMSAKAIIEANTLATAVSTAAPICMTAIAADMATCSAGTLGVGTAACTPVLTAAETATTTALEGVLAQHALLQSIYQMPVLCCGSEGKLSAQPTIDIGTPRTPGTEFIDDSRTTINIAYVNLPTKHNIINRMVEYKQKTGGNNLVFLFDKVLSYEQVFSLFENEFNKTELDYVYDDLMKSPMAKKVIAKIEQGDISEILEKIMYNIYFQQIMEDIRQRKIKDPVYERNLIAYHLNQLDKKMHAKRMLDLNENELASIKNNFQKLFSTIIPNAYAEGDEGFGPLGEWLAVGGGGAGVAALLLLWSGANSFVKSVLESAEGRLWLWGILIVLTGGVITKNGFSVSDVSEKLNIIKREKRKFKNATKSGGDSGFASSGADPYSGTTYENTKYDKQALQSQNTTMCASMGSDGSFMPASCPSKVAPGSFNVNNGLNRIKGNLSPSHLQGLSSLAATAQEVASTGTMNPSTLSSGNLEGVKNNNAAMRKANEQLKKQYDEKYKKYKTDKNPVTTLSSVNDQVRAAMKSRGPVNANTAQAADALAKDISKSMEEDLRKEGKGEGQITTGDVPKIDVATPNFDFNMGDEQVPASNDDLGLSGLGEEKDLKDFVLKHNDINNKKEVSIFKILSNRYILSYPKIIPEKKSKTPEASKAPEKVEPSKPLTLEDKLEGAR